MKDDQIFQEVVDAWYDHDYNKTEAAEALDLPRTTFRRYLEEALDRGIEPRTPQRTQESLERRKYEDRLSQISAMLRDTQREQITIQDARELLGLARRHTYREPDWAVDAPRGPTTGHPGIPTLFLSDFHWGEVVSKEITGNAYNLDIAKERLAQTVSNTLDLCNNHILHNNDFPGIVVLLGGDMLSGHIHDDIRMTNQIETMPALFDLFDNLVAAIDLLASEFTRVLILTAYGNHARNTRKPPTKDAALTNFEWILYSMLERHYTGNDDITVNVTEAYDTLYRIYNMNYLLTHGDRLGTGGGNGIIGSIGPILRGTQKIKQQYLDMGKQVDVVLMGHYHTMRWMVPHCIVNGSLKGPDEYATGLRMGVEAPQQALWFTHPKHGIIHMTPIFCDDGDSRILSREEKKVIVW